MPRTIISICVLVAATVSLLASPARAEDPADAFKSCVRCHGQDGNSAKPSAPSIAGFRAEYIAASMREYREGRRQCGTSKMKCRMAAKWTDEEIDSAAAHYSQFKRVAPKQEFDSALAAKGKAIHEDKCASCHSAEPTAAAGTQPAGILNGQWREYLDYALGQYENGGRHQPDEMRAAGESLDAAAKEALLHYYASGQ